MSALRLSAPGQPTRLIPVDTGCTPRRLGPFYLQGGTPVSAQPAGKKPMTPEQRAAHNAKSRAYHHANAERALERQRRYRKRMKGVAGRTRETRSTALHVSGRSAASMAW